MGGIKVEGVENLQKKLKKNVTMSDIKTIVRHNGTEMHKKAIRYVPVDTGTLKRSIGLELTGGGMTAEVEPGMDYAGYVEYGTRYMEAQPYMRPAYEEQKQKFLRDLKKVTE